MVVAVPVPTPVGAIGKAVVNRRGHKNDQDDDGDDDDDRSVRSARTETADEKLGGGGRGGSYLR